MQEINKVLSKWSKKIELKSHEIKLNLLSDLMKNVNKGLADGGKMKSFINTSESVRSKLDDLEKEYVSNVEELNRSLEGFNIVRDNVVVSWKRASKHYEKIVNISSDLGVPIPSKAESAYRELDELYNFQKNSYPKAPVKTKKLPNF